MKNFKVIDRKFKTKDLVSFLGYMVDIYSAVNLNRSKWLTNKERQFFICFVLMYNEGIDNYLHGRVKKILEEGANISRTGDINGYMKDIRDKDWLTFNTKTKKFNIHNFFKGIDLDRFEVKLDVNINYRADEVV